MAVPAIVPTPTRVTAGDGTFRITAATGVDAPPAIADLLRELLKLPLPAGNDLTFRLVDDPSLGDEGYRLTVGDSGVAATASTEAGLRWAIQTLRQLHGYAESSELVLPHVEIEDRPRLPWRGALLDVARWCHPIEFLFRFVDHLAMHKLNTLHLHLTDDQGWRFEVRKYPRLTEVGGWRRESNAGHARDGKFDGTPHGGSYTQDQLRELVAYAARRGVHVMPEIDLPGHMQAAISAYPWLGNSDEQLEVRTAWGISKHVLNTSDRALAFARDVLDEVVDVFPFDYVHLGGDEVPLDEWTVSEAAQQRVRDEGLAGTPELLGWWIKQMGAHLAERGRKIAVWDELVDADPPKDALIFAWRGVERVAAALAAGHQVVAVPQSHVYLDHAESDTPGEPLSIGGHIPLEKVLSYDPVPAGADGQVLGTQGMLWSEYTPTPQQVEWRAWPRLAAVADIAWSASPQFASHLDVHSRRLRDLRINYHR
jgi:hexosaminidase